MPEHTDSPDIPKEMDAPESTPDTTPDSMPEAKPETKPDTTPKATPNSTPNMTPNTTPDTRTRILWRGDKLVALAKERYCAGLTDLETTILQSVGAGEMCDCEGQEVAADFLVWMCTDEAAREIIPHTGIRLWKATFTKEIDLMFAVVPFPLRMFKCTFQQNITLRHTRLHSLFLNGSTCTGILADGLATQGNLNLSAITNTDSIRLLGANIGGDVSCNGATLTAPEQGEDEGRAFNADRLTTKGNFSFDSAEVHGAIRLLGANIGGTVYCENATLTAPEQGEDQGRAFYADRLTTKGGLFLRGSETKVQGAIRLLGANIGGNIECDNATLTAPENGGDKGRAFHADRLTTKGSLFFRGSETKVQGAIRLLGANIGGDVDCTNATLTAPEKGEDQGRALYADGLVVGGSLFLRNNFLATGLISLVRATLHGGLCLTDQRNSEKTILDLRYAHAGVLYDDPQSWPAKGILHLNGFTYDAIADGSPTDFASRKDWLDRMPDDGKFRPQPYEQLAKVLREAGHTGDAKAILIEKNRRYSRQFRWLPFRTIEEIIENAVTQERIRQLNRQQSTALENALPRLMDKEKSERKLLADRISLLSQKCRFWKKLWFTLFGLLLGYGYKPFRPLAFMLGFIIFGFGLFYWAEHAQIMDKFQTSGFKPAVEMPALPNGEKPEHPDIATFAPSPYPEFSAFWYSLDSFIPLVDLHQEIYWMPDLSKRAQCSFLLFELPLSGVMVRWYLWIHILSGWILTSLFVVGLTGMMRKDE